MQAKEERKNIKREYLRASHVRLFLSIYRIWRQRIHVG